MAQRKERSDLKQRHQKRWVAETKERTERLPKGFKAIWSFMTGKYQENKRRNEAETQDCKQRDRQEVQELIERQITQRRKLLFEVKQVRQQQKIEKKDIIRRNANATSINTAMQNENSTNVKEKFPRASISRNKR